MIFNKGSNLWVEGVNIFEMFCAYYCHCLLRLCDHDLSNLNINYAIDCIKQVAMYIVCFDVLYDSGQQMKSNTIVPDFLSSQIHDHHHSKLSFQTAKIQQYHSFVKDF